MNKACCYYSIQIGYYYKKTEITSKCMLFQSYFLYDYVSINIKLFRYSIIVLINVKCIKTEEYWIQNILYAFKRANRKLIQMCNTPLPFIATHIFILGVPNVQFIDIKD